MRKHKVFNGKKRSAKRNRLDGESITIILIGLFIGGLLGMWIIETMDGSQAIAAEPRPYHGRLEVVTSSERVAPFKIVTPEGSRGYVVKLVDAYTGEIALSVFLESGRSYETNAPLGAYKLRWASGRDWVSDDALFGPLTDVQEAIEPIVFEREGAGFTGHTIELAPRIDGNLESSRVRASNF